MRTCVIWLCNEDVVTTDYAKDSCRKFIEVVCRIRRRKLKHAILVGSGSVPLRTHSQPAPFRRPEGCLAFPKLVISAAGFLAVTLGRATHNPKVGGSNPPPATMWTLRD